MLTIWPIQFVFIEAPFLCAREGKQGILTNFDTARLVGRSRCCKSLISQRLVWNVSIQGDSVHSCGPYEEEATAFPSEEDEAMREWRQELPEQTRRAIIRIHTEPWSPSKFNARKDDLRRWWK